MAKGRVVVSVATDVCVATGDWTSVEADVRRAAGVKGVTNESEIKADGVPRHRLRSSNRGADHGDPPSSAGKGLLGIFRVSTNSRERLSEAQEQ